MAPCECGTRRPAWGPPASRAPPRMRLRSVPPAACEAAEGDEPDQDDDQPEPKAPHDHHHDADDHDDAASRYASDSTTTFRGSHPFLLLSFARAACPYPSRDWPIVIAYAEGRGARLESRRIQRYLSDRRAC